MHAVNTVCAFFENIFNIFLMKLAIRGAYENNFDEFLRLRGVATPIRNALRAVFAWRVKRAESGLQVALRQGNCLVRLILSCRLE
jgi:hypothetical protein